MASWRSRNRLVSGKWWKGSRRRAEVRQPVERQQRTGTAWVAAAWRGRHRMGSSGEVSLGGPCRAPERIGTPGSAGHGSHRRAKDGHAAQWSGTAGPEGMAVAGHGSVRDGSRPEAWRTSECSEWIGRIAQPRPGMEWAGLRRNGRNGTEGMGPAAFGWLRRGSPRSGLGRQDRSGSLRGVRPWTGV